MNELISRVKGAIMSSVRDRGVAFSDGEGVARAAIAAMREPTPEMVDAMENLMRGVIDLRESAMAVWRAGCDASLDEKKMATK